MKQWEVQWTLYQQRLAGIKLSASRYRGPSEHDECVRDIKFLLDEIERLTHMMEMKQTPPAGQRWTRKRNKQSLLASIAPMVARDLAPLYKHICSKAKEKPMFSNELTPAENERLALLAEEMGEAIQVIGKILRHGYESTGPKTIVRNRTSLEKELGDVRLAISLMVDSGDLSSANLKDFEEDKRRRVGQYLHHNTLTPNEATE